jgi:hypothetical protein
MVSSRSQSGAIAVKTTSALKRTRDSLDASDDEGTNEKGSDGTL